ncbi:MAG: CoA transferase, partial [Pseudomonadota bacterium]
LVGRRDGGSEVDYTVNPQTGLPFLTGPADSDAPVNHVLPAWDLVAGQMMATGLLAAERHRRRHGEGQLVRLALKDVALAALGHLGMIAETSLHDTDRPKYGNYLYGAFGCDFVTADEKRIMVVGLTRQQWSGLLKATDLAEAFDALGERLALNLKDEGNRFRAREDIAAVLQQWIGARPLDDIAPLFAEHRVSWGPYRTLRESLDVDPDCSTDNPMFANVDQPGAGEYLVPGTPYDFGAVPRTPPARAPRLGEHTDEILLDVLGLPEAEVGALHDAGVVAGHA